MADNKGFRQTYQETGKITSGGGPGEKNLDKGASGSKRANNAVKGKPARSSKVGPDKNLKDIGGGNFYWYLGRINSVPRISEIMKDIIGEIIGRVKTEINDQAEAVTAGVNINSFDDYKQSIGTIQGLQLALDIVNEILTEDDEDNS